MMRFSFHEKCITFLWLKTGSIFEKHTGNSEVGNATWRRDSCGSRLTKQEECFNRLRQNIGPMATTRTVCAVGEAILDFSGDSAQRTPANSSTPTCYLSWIHSFVFSSELAIYEAT